MECKHCKKREVTAENWSTGERLCSFCDMMLCFKLLGAQIILSAAVIGAVITIAN